MREYNRLAKFWFFIRSIVEDEDNEAELERDAEEKGEEFDFNTRFDDDQKEDVVAIKEEEREQNQFELTDAGKELKKLVRTLDNTLFESVSIVFKLV